MRIIPILLYHSVSDDPSPALARYTVSPTLFREHASVLADQGWRVLTIAELDHRIALGRLDDEPTMALTFDDGFADTAERAAPILADYGFPATLYVTTGCVGSPCEWLGPQGRRPMASWSQLRDLASSGWEIGAHSVSHPELDVLPLAAARQQIRDSRASLQERLGLPVDSFAYPHGYHSTAVRREVIDAGFRTACAVKNALSSERDDPFARARLTVISTLSAEELGWMLGGGDTGEPPVASVRERPRTTAWRCYRRLRQRTVLGARAVHGNRTRSGARR